MPLPLLIRETPLNNCEDHIFTSDYQNVWVAAAGRTHPSDLAARHLMYRTYTSDLKFFFSAGRTGYGSFTLGKRHLPGHAAFSVSPPRLSIEFSKTRMRTAVSILISSSAWDGARSACMLAYSFRQPGKFLGLSGF